MPFFPRETKQREKSPLELIRMSRSVERWQAKEAKQTSSVAWKAVGRLAGEGFPGEYLWSGRSSRRRHDLETGATTLPVFEFRGSEKNEERKKSCERLTGWVDLVFQKGESEDWKISTTTAKKTSCFKTILTNLNKKKIWQI